MRSFVCLFLDKNCRVMHATIFRGVRDDASAYAKRLNQEHRSWGYEIWADGRRIEDTYDCDRPPSRAHITQ